MKLNSDGAASQVDDNVSIGGVFWDADRRWLCGYSQKSDKDTVFRIEVCTILEGLHIAWGKGYRRLENECDNLLLVESFLHGSVANNSNLMELRLIDDYIHRDW